MVNKKGYFYIVELLLVVLIVSGVLFYFPHSEQSHMKYEEKENMKTTGYGALYSLDEKGILGKYFELNITESNFAKLSSYIKNSIPDYRLAKIEYIYNNYTSDYSSFSQACLNSTGDTTSCGQVSSGSREKVIPTIYTYYEGSNPITIRLYLKRRAI